MKTTRTILLNTASALALAAPLHAQDLPIPAPPPAVEAPVTVLQPVPAPTMPAVVEVVPTAMANRPVDYSAAPARLDKPIIAGVSPAEPAPSPAAAPLNVGPVIPPWSAVPSGPMGAPPWKWYGWGTARPVEPIPPTEGPVQRSTNSAAPATPPPEKKDSPPAPKPSDVGAIDLPRFDDLTKPTAAPPTSKAPVIPPPEATNAPNLDLRSNESPKSAPAVDPWNGINTPPGVIPGPNPPLSAAPGWKTARAAASR